MAPKAFGHSQKNLSFFFHSAGSKRVTGTAEEITMRNILGDRLSESWPADRKKQ